MESLVDGSRVELGLTRQVEVPDNLGLSGGGGANLKACERDSITGNTAFLLVGAEGGTGKCFFQELMQSASLNFPSTLARTPIRAGVPPGSRRPRTRAAARGAATAGDPRRRTVKRFAGTSPANDA
eukprot:2549133-Pyramimonas_sp.AAC.1